MGVIKGVLKEELENSLRMLKSYKKGLAEYPGGTFVRKEIRGHKYYYLAVREGKKIKFVYKGKKLDKREVEKLAKIRKMRQKHKQMIKKLNNRIKYLRKVLRGKEDI